MSKSESKKTGRGSPLYNANGVAWLLIFFVVRICSIPILLRYGVMDFITLSRSATGSSQQKSVLGRCRYAIAWAVFSSDQH